MIAKQMVIYIPPFGCSIETKVELRRRYPTAKWVEKWQADAIMWQDAIGKKYPEPGLASNEKLP